MKKYEEGEKPRLPFIQATLMKYSPEYPLAEQVITITDVGDVD